MNLNKRLGLQWSLVLGWCLFPASGWSQSQWEQSLADKAQESMAQVVQNRAVVKAQRFQLWGPAVGLSERADFYNHYFVGLGGRYHFSESQAWEVRGTGGLIRETGAAQTVRERTGLSPDSQPAKYSVSTGYVLTPIYGKYAWNKSSLVHFDSYAVLSAGLRFARDIQIFGEVGVGMNHYLTERLALVPEVRVRLYQEQRTQPTWVSELMLQVGISWLL